MLIKKFKVEFNGEQFSLVFFLFIFIAGWRKLHFFCAFKNELNFSIVLVMSGEMYVVVAFVVVAALFPLSCNRFQVFGFVKLPEA